ncbi:sigma-70 family RNA polymerase sigma factor [Modestobacter italicus]|uniref:sigma-70 family RNA polymerase sigma factor n=1 Tax=Modestobacter italicus (strain DSM 44449 / CECT 9708 / BC 501) TaxID=2732864 RepID=UPI00068447F7|nr:sigma-70 family RNA polymerase sigma factor [Modestobacter marinus]
MTTAAGPAQGRIPEDSIAELLDRWTRPALSLARRIVVDDRLAEEVVQEAFVAYWRHPGAYQAGRGSFGTWFLALVHHKAVDAVRHEASHRRRSAALAVRDGHAIGTDVAEVVADRLADARVRTALDALPAPQREALVLAYWGGSTQTEIAARTGTPLGTVKTRMLLGMRRLHDALTVTGVPA